ncbi:organic hydroperoxide resistance protein [Virgisporangium ochraceum]
MKVLYTAEVTATGDGRNGHVTSTDKLIDVDVARPVEMGGTGGATNPEQLFAAGYSTCFHSALRRVAQLAGVDVTESLVTVPVGIVAIGEGRFGLTAALDIALPAVPRDQGEELVRKAHQVCPYSNATRGNIDVTVTLVDSAEVTP